MSQYPPPPPYGSGRYSPGRPAYSDRPPFPPTLPSNPNPNTHSRDYPPYPYPNSAPPPPTAYRPYDPYSNDARPPAPYPQPRDPYAPDSYDPYSPSTAYNPSTPSLRFPPSSSPPTRHDHPPPRPIARPASPPRRVAQSTPLPKTGDGTDLNMLLPAVTTSVAGFTTAVYSLPSSQLPLDKYIAVNPADCIDIHRALCRKSKSVWYADGCSRAGEGWYAAIEWIIENGQSGRKMRVCIPGGDGLDAELGAICKAVEGFQELLHISIKEGTPMSHELIVFCDSAAALVGIDTSSRPESLRFEQLWRAVCSDFYQAHITFVWLPKNSGIEGHVLSDKIAVVAASNSYLKKKKDGTLPDAYRRAGGGEALPSGSAEAGAWQRGDADPSRRKEPFHRPKPVPISPPPPVVEEVKIEEEEMTPEGEQGEVLQQFAEVDGQVPPPKEAIFVTSFPDTLSAKDLGVLYAQFGDLTSVDIYHTDPTHPRFAYVQYTTLESGLSAIQTLHNKPIDFTAPYARTNAADLADWGGWQGCMLVVRNEPGRFVPKAVEGMFPGIAGWMTGQEQEGVVKEENGEGEKIKEEAEEEGDRRRKRTRSVEKDLPNGLQLHSTGSSTIDSPSPHKRPRQASSAAPAPESVPVAPTPSAPVKQLDFAAQLSDLVSKVETPLAQQRQQQSAPPNPAPTRSTAAAHFTPPPANLPPFPPTINRNSNERTRTPQPSHVKPIPSNGLSNGALQHPLPPTPQTAERPTAPSQAAHLPSPFIQNQPQSDALPTPTTPVPAQLPPHPAQAPTDTVAPAPTPALAQPASTSTSSRPPLTNSAAEPQEYPILLSPKTLQSQLALVTRTFVKHDINNWIAHSCLIAVDMDQARRALQADLFATDEGFLTGRDLEKELIAQGYTAPRVDAFITKVLKVLDGIALAESLDAGGAEEGEGGGGGAGDTSSRERVELGKELYRELGKYPDQTKEAIKSAGIMMEYLHRGKELQEKKRLDVERRVKVLEGMVKIGEHVGKVVRFLLTEGSG